MSASTVTNSSYQDKSVMQAILERVTGRNLDPVEVTYSYRTQPVGRGYHQSIYVETTTNLRTGDKVTTETKGGVA